MHTLYKVCVRRTVHQPAASTRIKQAVCYDGKSMMPIAYAPSASSLSEKVMYKKYAPIFVECVGWRVLLRAMCISGCGINGGRRTKQHRSLACVPWLKRNWVGTMILCWSGIEVMAGCGPQ